jgi:putative transposase
MRYPASEKLGIIRLVEGSRLPLRRILDKLGIPATTFYRWYARYRELGEGGLTDRVSTPGRVWNRIPDSVRQQIIDLALEEPELSPREQRKILEKVRRQPPPLRHYFQRIDSLTHRALGESPRLCAVLGQ